MIEIYTKKGEFIQSFANDTLFKQRHGAGYEDIWQAIFAYLFCYTDRYIIYSGYKLQAKRDIKAGT